VRELEEKRINKEMANIRKKFKGSGHQARRYIRLISLFRREFGWIPKEEVCCSLTAPVPTEYDLTDT
jgi:hypothetical protein